MRKTKKQQAMPKSEAESFGIKRNPAIRAPRIYLSEEEVIRIMRKEAAIKKKIGNLIDSMLCDDSQISAMDNIKNKTEAFDIDVIVKTCSDICFTIGQKNCQMFVAKLHKFHHPHNRMRFYPAHSVLSFPDFAVDLNSATLL